jgi:hypothetical protein
VCGVPRGAPGRTGERAGGVVSWTIKAACAGRRDLPWDHSGSGVGPQGPGVDAALTVCREVCPVTGSCRDAADLEEVFLEPHGIRGGETVPERIARRGR